MGHQLCANAFTLLFSPEKTSLLKVGDNEPYFPGNGRLAMRSDLPPVDITNKLPFPVQDIQQIQAANAFTVYLTKDGKLYGEGSNQFGQMGDKNIGFFKEITEIVLPPELICSKEENQIIQISGGICGGLLVLTKDGRVFSAGECNGRPGDNSPGLKQIPTSVFGNDSVVFVSAGGCVSIFITNSGGVYSCGYNSNAEGAQILGHGHEPHAILIPRRIEALHDLGVNAVSGSAGRMHCIVIDDQGHLYGWGTNTAGQLGIYVSDPSLRSNPKDSSVVPQRLIPQTADGKDVIFSQVSCSWSHSLALSVDGVPYSLGISNQSGELGRNVDAANPSAFDCMDVGGRKIDFVNAGQGHSLLLAKTDNPLTDAYIATCGSAFRNQLGGDGSDIVRVRFGLSRLLPRFMTWEEIVSSGTPLNVSNHYVDDGHDKKRIRRSDMDDWEQDNLSADEEEDESFEEENDFICINVDYDGTPITSDNDVSDIMREVSDKILNSVDFLDNETYTSAKFSVLIANHYGFASLRALTDGLANGELLSRLGDRLHELVFVSCCLFANSTEDVTRFVETLARYPCLESIRLDQTALSCDKEKIAQELPDTEDDEAIVELCRVAPQMITSLKTLVLEDLGDKAVEALCSSAVAAHFANDGAASTTGVNRLQIDLGRFTARGFDAISALLKANTSLQRLSIPRHTHISDNYFSTLVDGLVGNSHLQVLDCHVEELVHYGVTSKGLEKLVTFLESKNGRLSGLCAVDVSGDDGAPEISRSLQRQMTTCLVRNADKTSSNELKKLAKLKVYERHSDE